MNTSTPDMFNQRVCHYPLIQRLSPQEEAKLEMKHINVFDYDKMLEEFRFNDTLNKIKKNRLHKIKTANSVYRTNVNLMKTKVQEMEQKRIKNIQNELKEKNRIVDANKYQKSKEKEDDRLKAKSTRLHLKKISKRNAKSHSASLEEKRLEEEERTMKRCKFSGLMLQLQ